MVELPARTKLILLLITPPKVPLPTVVKLTVEAPELVSVPPMPGRPLLLDKAPTTWSKFFRSTMAPTPLIVKPPTVAFAAVGITDSVFAAPEFRFKVPPLTTVVPV